MNNKEVDPENLGGLGDMLPADVLEKLNQLLEMLHQTEGDKKGSTVIIYAPGSQYVDTQINIEAYPHPLPKGGENIKEREKGTEDRTPPPDVMAMAVEKTINNGLWATNTCWSVVYVVYRILGYDGGISEFVREVESWKFTKTLKYKCNRDSVGKPLRDRRMSYNLNHWLNDGVQRPFYLLAVALLEEIKRTFPSFPSDIPHLP